MEKTRNTGGAQFGILLILLLALLLRLAGLWWGQGYFYFGQGDGVVAYTVAVDYAKGEPRAQYIGQPNYNENSKLPGPLWTMFCLAGLRFWGSMEGVMILSVLLNTAAVYLIYLLAERTVGSPGALWAGLLAATLPWAVFYSVGVYNPEVMMFLGAVLSLSLWEVVRNPRSPHIFWVALMLLVMPQFHMAGLGLIPTVAVIIALASARVSWGWLLAGLAVGAFCYAPYIRGDMAQGWQNTHGMFSGKSMRSWDSLKTLTTPLNLLVNWVPRFVRNFHDYWEVGRACFGAAAILALVNLISLVAALGMLGGAFAQVGTVMRGKWRSPREAFKGSPAVLFLTLVALGPLFFALVSGHAFHSRYALVLMPGLIGMAAFGLSRMRAWPRFGRVFQIALVFTLCANVWFMGAYYYHQGRQIESGPVFIPSFRKMETVYQALRAHAGAERGVVVDSTEFLRTMRPGETELKEAALLTRYVPVRERELDMLRGAVTESVRYRLCRAEEAGSGDPKVAYRGNGIALVAETDK
jgi:hypothetical protein